MRTVLQTTALNPDWKVTAANPVGPPSKTVVVTGTPEQITEQLFGRTPRLSKPEDALVPIEKAMGVEEKDTPQRILPTILPPTTTETTETGRRTGRRTGRKPRETAAQKDEREKRQGTLYPQKDDEQQ